MKLIQNTRMSKVLKLNLLLKLQNLLLKLPAFLPRVTSLLVLILAIPSEKPPILYSAIPPSHSVWAALILGQVSCV